MASRKAAAAAENTEALNGALTPKPRVMPSANATKKQPAAHGDLPGLEAHDEGQAARHLGQRDAPAQRR